MPGHQQQKQAGLSLDWLPSPAALGEQVSDMVSRGNSDIQQFLDGLMPDDLELGGFSLDDLGSAGEAIEALADASANTGGGPSMPEENADAGGPSMPEEREEEGGGFWDSVADVGEGLWDDAVDLGEGLWDGAVELGEDALDIGESVLDGAADLGEDLWHEAVEWWSGFEAPDDYDSPKRTTIDGERTKHSDATAGDALNADELPELSEAAVEEVEAKVEVVATEAEPAEGLTPPESSVFVRKDEGAPIQYMAGTMTAPNDSMGLSPSALYINGGPSVDDVNQTNFGDCYFQSQLAGLAGRAPAYLSNSIRDEGDSVTIRLWRSDGTAFIPAPIRVNRQLLHFRDGSLASAGFKVSTAATDARWWAEVEGPTLWLSRQRLHEAALWAPLMEKAYASYAQQYGQNGGLDAGAHDSESSGYDRISQGGYSGFAAAILLGPNQTGVTPDGQSTPDEYIEFTDSGGDMNTPRELVDKNIETIRRLVSLGASGEDGKDPRTILETGLSPIVALERFLTVSEEMADRFEDDLSEDLAAELEELDEEWDAWETSGRSESGDEFDDIVARAKRLRDPDLFPELHAADAKRLYSQLNEKANIVSQLGTDSSNDQRFIYAWHSYTVLEASFMGPEGALSLTSSNLEDNLDSIRPGTSTVKLRNPHGTNTPDEHGKEGGADQGDGGNFSLSLLQFLQTFEWTTELKLQ